MYYSNAYLSHHGIKGQKWGVRRFQNADGTFTSAGKKRYNDSDGKTENSGKKKGLSDRQKKAIKIGAAVAGTAVAAYGAYKLSGYVKNQNAIKAGQKRVEAALKAGEAQRNANVAAFKKGMDATANATRNSMGSMRTRPSVTNGTSHMTGLPSMPSSRPKSHLKFTRTAKRNNALTTVTGKTRTNADVTNASNKLKQYTNAINNVPTLDSLLKNKGR